MSLTAASRADLESLRARLTGQVVTPDDDSYDTVRALWNGAFDRYPALIVRCASTADVVESIRFARERDLPIAVRGGGHSVPGLSSCDGGVMVDLQPMRSISVDPQARVAVAQPGLTWGRFDAATQEHGLATTGGEVSHTGIAGLTLGGGIGWLKRVHGLTCDNLLGVELATADGRVVQAGEDEEPELFWALRGGGGNFGVVTEFRYRLHPVGVCLGGAVMHPLSHARDVMRLVSDMAAHAEDATSFVCAIVTAPPAPFVPPELQGRPVLMVAAWHLGTVEAGERALAPLRRIGPPAVDMVHALGYCELQQLIDASVPHGLHYHVRSEMLTGLGDDVVDAAIEAGAHMSSPLSQVLLHQLGGAVSRVPRSATAYPHRDAAWMLTVNAAWTRDDGDGERHTRWARQAWSSMRGASTGGVYVNHLGGEGQERVRQAYGEASYRRLAAVKARWDPDNVFRLNQNIMPALA